MKARNVSEAKKKTVAGRQFFKCANRPGLLISGLENYKCPLWQLVENNKGSFDESGYEIDHIVEHSISGNDKINNLQALCKMCHTVKTKRFNSKLVDSESEEISSGELSDVTVSKKKPSAYNIFVSKEMKKLRTKQPDLPNTEYMKKAAENWNKQNGVTVVPVNKSKPKKKIFVDIETSSSESEADLEKEICSFSIFTCNQLRYISILLGYSTGGTKQKIINRIIRNTESYSDLMNSIEKNKRKKYLITCTGPIDYDSDNFDEHNEHSFHTNKSIIKGPHKHGWTTRNYGWVNMYCKECKYDCTFQQRNNEFYKLK